MKCLRLRLDLLSFHLILKIKNSFRKRKVTFKENLFSYEKSKLFLIKTNFLLLIVTRLQYYIIFKTHLNEHLFRFLKKKYKKKKNNPLNLN
jgi:hypothetical protein